MVVLPESIERPAARLRSGTCRRPAAALTIGHSSISSRRPARSPGPSAAAQLHRPTAPSRSRPARWPSVAHRARAVRPVPGRPGAVGKLRALQEPQNPERVRGMAGVGQRHGHPVRVARPGEPPAAAQAATTAPSGGISRCRSSSAGSPSIAAGRERPGEYPLPPPPARLHRPALTRRQGRRRPTVRPGERTPRGGPQHATARAGTSP